MKAVGRDARPGELTRQLAGEQYVRQLRSLVCLHDRVFELEAEIVEVERAAAVADGRDGDNSRRRALEQERPKQVREQEIAEIDLWPNVRSMPSSVSDRRLFTATSVVDEHVEAWMVALDLGRKVPDRRLRREVAEIRDRFRPCAPADVAQGRFRTAAGHGPTTITRAPSRGQRDRGLEPIPLVAPVIRTIFPVTCPRAF